jgi:hypothetical protein
MKITTSIQLRFLLFKFYMGRLWFVMTQTNKAVYILKTYEQRGTKLIELAEKANGLCVRKF